MRFRNINFSVDHLQSGCSAACQTFSFSSACDEDDDEDNENQEQEGGENVDQWQEKMVSLVWQDNIDDSR